MQTYIVDAFTDVAFRGNPAGVCILTEALSDESMLLIAQELNLSETAFLKPGTKAGEYAIRYFSPKMEIPLCGHATIASAKVVFIMLDLQQVIFTTAQGLRLYVKQDKGKISMEFPVYSTMPAEAPKALQKALGISEIVNSAYNAETRILLLEIKSTSELASLAPDFSALQASHDGINGVLVTAAAVDDYDFHSRYFWPWSGTNEDPVTGGTHTFLTPYWSSRLGKRAMKSFQSSKRSGSMEVELIEDKLLIRGEAVIVFEGQLRI